MKAYIISNKDHDTESNVAVIADTANEAKSLAFKDEKLYDTDYIDLRVTVCKNGNIKGLAKGIIPIELDALKRGIFDYLQYADCPQCGANDVTVNYDNGFSCSECEDKIGAEE